MSKASADRGRLRVTGFDSDRSAGPDRPPADTTHSATDTTHSTTDATRPSRWRRIWRQFRRNRSATTGLAIVACLSLLAVFARPIELWSVTVQPISIAPYPPDELLWIDRDISRNQPPSLAHPMGTDGSGRDVFSRFVAGGRYSISIGLIIVAITATVGLVYGSISGYYGGWIDELMMRIVDMILAFPGFLLALLIVATFDSGYWQLVAAFSVFGWAIYARLVRGEVLSVTEQSYVLAAKAIGARDRGVIARHIIPNVISPLIVLATLNIGTVVISVAALGFLGLGLPAETAEWGTMLENGRDAIVPGPDGQIRWWITVFPGTAIFLFVLSMNLIGDGITDALDARETTLESYRDR